MPRFSVVVAVYNKESYIRATLESVLKQTFGDLELVVYNDGSTDSSKSIINSINDNRIRYYEGPNKGAGAARNTALSKAKGELIALLDADDIWRPDHLEVLDKAIRRYPDQRVFATDSILLQDQFQYGRTYSGGPYRETTVVDFFQASLVDSIINSSTLVVYPEVLEKVGIYDPGIKSGQDTDLWIRIGLEYRVVFIPRVTVHIVRDWSSLSRSTKSLDDKPNFAKYEHLEADRPALKQFLDRNRFSLSLLARISGDGRSARKLRRQIDPASLTLKQRILLRLPRILLSPLNALKAHLEKRGQRLSSYK